MRTAVIGAAMAIAGVAVIAAPATVGLAKSDPDVLYKSIPSPLPDNLPSVGFQATQTAEFGNQINFTKTASPLATVKVTMSSFACQSGAWFSHDCSTTPGATFTEPITFNIYNANAPQSILPGSLITSVTKTFKIPYRPSVRMSCSNGGWGASCSNGKAATITFNFSSLHVNLPSSVVYGVAYNTTSWGYHPIGTQPCDATAQGCPYDSLNVGLSQDPTNLSRGTDANPGKAFLNSATPSNYCDGGTAGTGVFRLDSPGTATADQCWSVGTPGTAPYYIPAVEFDEG
jgi:hypothetical protein